MFENNVPTASHNLWQCFTVAHSLGFPFSDKLTFFFRFCIFTFGTVFSDCFILCFKHFPPMTYAQLVNSLRNELLHMEAVINQGGSGKSISSRQHHSG